MVFISVNLSPAFLESAIGGNEHHPSQVPPIIRGCHTCPQGAGKLESQKRYGNVVQGNAKRALVIDTRVSCTMIPLIPSLTNRLRQCQMQLYNKRISYNYAVDFPLKVHIGTVNLFSKVDHSSSQDS